MSCGASTTQTYDDANARFALFISWLLSKKTQSEMGFASRTFRDKISPFWSYWPIAPVCDEIHHVVHVDGIWLSHSCVILIACTDSYVMGWHLARSESANGWAALMSRIAPPDVVVADGGSGFEKARRITWPNTRVQRCTFHAYNQVKRCTTTRPRTQAGVDLHAIARALSKVNSLNDAALWIASFASWCTRYEDFLKEKTIVDGRTQYKHERLRKARRGLEKLVRSETLFTHSDPELLSQGYVPNTNNQIEGGINRQIRAMLNEHRGMGLDHMIKAVFWYCYMHTECPMNTKDILKETPTDKTITELYKAADQLAKRDELVERWGAAVGWSDLHTNAPYRSHYD